MNTNITNKTKLKRFVLTIANETFSTSEMPDEVVDSNGRVWNHARSNAAKRGKRFTQVSQTLLDDIERDVRRMIINKIESSHQTGKTVR